LRGNWPIRVKVFICLGLLLLLVTLLAGVGIYASNAYRDLVKALQTGPEELPIAHAFSRDVSDLRITFARLRERRSLSSIFGGENTLSDDLAACGADFTFGLDNVTRSLERYRGGVKNKPGGSRMDEKEWETIAAIDETLSKIRKAKQDEHWIYDPGTTKELATQLDQLQELATELPQHLYRRIGRLPREHREQYHALIYGTWVTGTVAAGILALLVKLVFDWVFRPLHVLIAGSRRVAGGDFDYRIRLDTRDEMAELAEALNDMTARFQAIHDDLENQVEERTRQVIRSEQLASVGFLAAGVAHEINNPLASIALCAESLENRVHESLDPGKEEHAVIGNYLRMIQTEAFRCKEITEKLLDFSRLGEVRRQTTDLGALVQDVIDMLRHLGKYQRRHIEFTPGESVPAPVNSQEIKQVVLNLLANALDSLDDGGEVRVQLRRQGPFAELTISDDGCGMEPEVLCHIFEPFFTRRRSGQGTGLGLSITYRIVAEHGGEIEAHSPGRGQGSTFRVRLPLVAAGKEPSHHRQAA